MGAATSDGDRALAAREQELAAIYGNVPGILFYVAVEPDGEFRFLSMSRAGLAAMGLSSEQIVGALVRDVIPPPSLDVVLDRYREAIRSGETVRWKEVSAYPSGEKVGEVAVTPFYDARGAPTHLIGIVHDVTEREHVEDMLQRRGQRMAFLLGLTDALRPLSDPAEIQDVTIRLLAEHLHANRVLYIAIDGDEFSITRSYAHGVASFDGHGPITAFGVTLLEEGRRGETIICGDIRTDSRYTDAERATLLANQIVAFAGAVLHREGRWVAALAIHSATPRAWTHDEIELIEQTAERMWWVEGRARARAALHAMKEEKHRRELQLLVETATQAALRERATELEALTGQLRQLASDLTLAEQRTRERLAGTMNDDLQQVLFGVSLTLARVEHDAAGSPVAKKIAQARCDVEQAMTAARALSLELLPPVLATATLPVAVGWLADWMHSKYGLRVDVTTDPRADIDRKDVFTLLFESLRELLRNVVTHAEIDRARVDLAIADDMLVITVSDDGVGFDVGAFSDKARNQHHPEVGIVSIRERLTLLGGRLEVESAPGHGTTCQLIAPVVSTRPDA